MVTDQGYIYHEYQYTTTDGYINTLHRVVKNGTTPHKKAVFLQHGLLGSAADFLLGHQNNSLGRSLMSAETDLYAKKVATKYLINRKSEAQSFRAHQQSTSSV